MRRNSDELWQGASEAPRALRGVTYLAMLSPEPSGHEAAMQDERRHFLRSAVGATLAAGAVTGTVANIVGTPAHAAAATPAVSAAPAASLVALSALELSTAIHSRRVSCVEVMQAHLSHIERINPHVNAIVSLQAPEGLLRQAAERDAQLGKGTSLGWMHGFPHAVKDLAATAGIRTSYGSPLLDGVPTEDSLHVARIRKAGAIFIGKTNAPEFGLGSQTYNPLFGTTLNAYDQTKTSGGSSGGAAVSLALDMVPVADGSDMMGSLRNPAAFNNVFGFRPSFGRVPSIGGEVFFDQLSVSGPMGRHVSDVAALLTTISGPDPRAPLSLAPVSVPFESALRRDLKGVRLGWLGDLDGYLPMQPGVLALCRRSFSAFDSIGASVMELKFPMPPAKLWDTWLTLRHWSTAADLGELYADPAKRARLKPEAQWEIQGAKNLSALDIYHASEVRSDWYRAMLELFPPSRFSAITHGTGFSIRCNAALAEEHQRHGDGYLSSLDAGGHPGEFAGSAGAERAGRFQRARTADGHAGHRAAAGGSRDAAAGVCLRTRDDVDQRRPALLG